MGKGTHILGFFDVDLVVFINNTLPPFEEQLERIEELLYLNFQNFIVLNKSPFSLKCKIDHVDFDILLAPNLIPPHSVSASPQEIQHKQLMTKFNVPSTSYSNIRPYSTAFCESIVHFIRSQDEIVHSVIRLAKIWKNTLIWNEQKYGMSFGIELLVCHTAEKLREKEVTLTVELVFQSFLQQLIDWQSLKAFWTLYYTKEMISAIH
jgi:hypothetical protein